MSHISENARHVSECPFCRELVTKGALRCPHCHADLRIPKKRRKRPFVVGPFMLGVYAATIFWLVFILVFLLKS